MKRRTFIKGLFGAAAAIGLPVRVLAGPDDLYDPLPEVTVTVNGRLIDSEVLNRALTAEEIEAYVVWGVGWRDG